MGAGERGKEGGRAVWGGSIWYALSAHAQRTCLERVLAVRERPPNERNRMHANKKREVADVGVCVCAAEKVGPPALHRDVGQRRRVGGEVRCEERCGVDRCR
eukprot:202440-Chlamydomonas_euryale.AAC.1